MYRARGVDTRAPRRVDSPDDTVSSWTNRRKDLRVICPAAATAGFFLPCLIQLCTWLHSDRRIRRSKCFARQIKKVVIFEDKNAFCSGTEKEGKHFPLNLSMNAKSLKIVRIFTRRFCYSIVQIVLFTSCPCILGLVHLYSIPPFGHHRCGF